MIPRQMIPVRISTDHRRDEVGDEIGCLTEGGGREGDAGLLHHVCEVGRPTDRDRACSEGKLEDQVPADDPGDELAEARVGERVGRAGHGDGAGKFRVAQRGEGAGDARGDERERDGRTRLFPGGLTRQDEDTGADDHADPENGEFQGAKPLAELMFGLFGVRDGLLDGLGAQEVHHSSPRTLTGTTEC